MPSAARLPLVVDLDGTLCLDDTLRVMCRRLVRERPWGMPSAARSLVGGRASLKMHLWERVGIDVPALLVAAELRDWLAGEARQGRDLYLATGAPLSLAEAVATHHGFFAGTRGTTAGDNLTGHRKAKALVERFGEMGFDYAGNSAADLAVWARSRGAIVCNASRKVRMRAQALGNVVREFP